MNIRDAILAAADHIERNPAAYRFTATDTGDGNCPACMWGHIGRMLGMPNFTQNWDVGERVFGRKFPMTDNPTRRLYETKQNPGERPTMNAGDAAALMRRFADEHFPATKAITREPTVNWQDCVWQPGAVA